MIKKQAETILSGKKLDAVSGGDYESAQAFRYIYYKCPHCKEDIYTYDFYIRNK